MKNNNFKALVLLTIITLGFTLPMMAQSDGFFRYNEDLYGDRATASGSLTNQTFGQDPGTGVAGGITNQQFGVPVGSGLLIMVAAGAGYAVARRKRARKGMTLLLAAAMLLGMTQCKKRIENVTPSNDGGVYITLRVQDNAKHTIVLSGEEANIGKVEFTEGDYLWVINGSQIVGKLYYSDSKQAFSGNIFVDPTHQWGGSTEPDTDDYLYFCYLSNIMPELDDDDDDKDPVPSFTVDLVDQTEKLPVVSIGRTDQLYGNYTPAQLQNLECELQNKCALVKFELDNATDKDVTLFGVSSSIDMCIEKGKVGYTPVTEYSSIIRLYNPSGTSSNVRWGIMLPDVERDADVLIGNTLYKEAVTVPAIINNQLIYSEPLTISTTGPQAELFRAYYNVLNGQWIEMAKSNLQYNKTTNEYSFMEHQWSTAEVDGDVGDLYENKNIVSLFGWGAWGTTVPYNTVGDHYDTETGSWTTNYEWQNDFDPTIEIDGKTGWRTMTNMEAMIMIITCDYYSATVNGVPGVLITPFTFTGTITSQKGPGIYSGWENVVVNDADEWQALEDAGVSFFPAAGRRRNTSVSDVRPTGYDFGYWTNGKNDYPQSEEVPPFVPHSMVIYPDGGYQFGVGPVWAAQYGFPVRLVRDVTFTTPTK